MISLLFSLIMLPFTLLFLGIRILFGLLGISTGILMLPLKLFARHTVFFLIVIGVVVLYLAFKKNPQTVDNMKTQAQEQQPEQAKNLPKGAIPIIQQVTTVEDGDSAFSTDTYAIMSDQERAAYSQNFYTIMRTAKDGEAKNWDFYNIQGSLRPIRTFTNNVGVTCRTFTETLKVHTIEQTISGTACDNGSGSWCKLKPNATPDCGLSHQGGGGMLNGISGMFKNLF